MNSNEKIRLGSVEKLCLYHNGNYAGAFDGMDGIDAYLREYYRWQTPDPDGLAKRSVNGDGAWSVMGSMFLKYETVENGLC